MLTKTYKGFTSLPIVILAVLVGIVSQGCGGGDNGKLEVLPPGATEGFRPIITSVVPNVANPGDQITINGRYFDDTRGDGTVTLNRLPLTIVSWSDSKIEAVLPTDATSGIIVVTVRGRSSQSTTNAQLFVGQAPPSGLPIITGLSQYSGYPGAIITVYGQNFGSTRPADGKVLFKSQAGEVEAEVRPVEGTENQYRWFDTSIQVKVPLGAISGSVVVEAGGARSNDNFTFQVEQEPPPPPGQPIEIHSFSPTEGSAGTIIRIEGNYFGHSRGSGVVQIGEANLEVVFWSNEEIFVKVIPEARTGNIVVVARGYTDRSTTPFVVIRVPQVTGVSPGRVRVGQPFTVVGRDFGLEAGSVVLTPIVPEGTPELIADRQKVTTISGSTATRWSDTEVYFQELPKLNSDAGFSLKVEVKNSLGQSSDDPGRTSDDVTVELVTNVLGSLEVFAEVQGADGNLVRVPQTSGVAGSTTLIFRAVAGGGEPNYRMDFKFGDGTSQVVADVDAIGEATHIYQTANTYDRIYVVISDRNQDTAVVYGPSIRIGAAGKPIITRIVVEKLGANVDDDQFKPNPVVGKYFGSHLGVVWNFNDDLVPSLPALRQVILTTPAEGEFAERNYQSFVGTRPIAYRVQNGSHLTIQGYNFFYGDTNQPNDVIFNAGPESGFPILANDFLVLSETKITVPFGVLVPNNTLAGAVRLRYTVGGEEERVDADIPLVVAPQLTVVPSSIIYNSDGDPNTPTTVTLTAYDPVPDPNAGDFIGDKAYLFWAFSKVEDLTNGGDWDVDNDNNPDLYVLPQGSEITLGEGSFNLDLESILRGLQPDQGYVARNPEYPTDPDATSYAVVRPYTSGVQWYIFLWVGVKPTADIVKFANSGIVSNAVAISLISP